MMRKALTTAELMIALTIIGVIAVLVLPSIIENYQKKIYLTKLKKTYMTISNAVEQASVDSNVSSFKLTPYAANYDKTAIASFFKKYLNIKNENSGFVSKYKIISDRAATEAEIAAMEAEMNAITDEDSKAKYAEKIALYASGEAKISERKSGVSNKYKTAILNGGEAIAMLCETASNNCYIFLDVNGKDDPNTEGRDMFAFRIDQSTNEVLDFIGSSYCTQGTATIGSVNIANGGGCLARIMEDNWNMNY